MKCPNCGSENLPGMKYCGQCGARLGQVCGNCGFVNPASHRFCGQCGTPLAVAVSTDALAALSTQPAPAYSRTQTGPPRPAPVRLEGERRRATVILADVVRSTDILERIGTEPWVEAMNLVLQLLEAEVYRFGGVVDQFRGDGLVAFFGAAAAHEDDPERAVLAALAMHRAIRPYAEELARQRNVELKLRVGVNTGEVIVASIGDDRHHTEDTAMGEAVALAARMESAAEPGTVLVSDNTYRLITSRFEWKALGSIPIKGLSQPVTVFRPLAPSSGAAWVQRFHAHELSARLIGREAESEILTKRVEELRTGRGGIVMLAGDTGMGKSALLASVRQHVVRDDALLAKAEGIETPLAASSPRSVMWLHARCRSYDQASPYSMWLDLLQGCLELWEVEPVTETHERVRRHAEELWGEAQAEHLPYLTAFLSLPMGEDGAERLAQLDGEGRRQQYFVTLRHWIEALARQRPLLVAFEDVHWADATSLALLEYCLSVCEHAPVLWVIVFRPERASPLREWRQRVENEYAHRLDCLALDALTQVQGGQMIDGLIGPNVLPPQARALLLERAEGNPYYIKEFVDTLAREGVLVQDVETGRWHATRAVETLDLPDSLQSLLLARIDRLASDERRVLQMAAVIGPVFWSGILAALGSDGLGPDVGALNDHLTALQRAQLVSERRKVSDLGIEYVFESNLVRDAAYKALLSVQRVSCHRKVADALEQIFGEKVLARYYSLLAYHYAQAGVIRKELFYTLLAAQEAQEIYANNEAIAFFARALQLLDEIEAGTSDKGQLQAIDSQRFEVLDGRRKTYLLTGQFDESWADAEALLPLAQKLEDDPVWLIDALLQQPGVGFARSSEEVVAGVSQVSEALSLARQLGDRRREMQCLGAMARQRFYLNDPSWQELAESALDMARGLGDKRYQAELLTAIGGVYALSDPDRSREYLETALPIIRDLDDKMAELELLEAVGTQLESSSDYHRRLTECHAKQLEISREIGHRVAEARALMFGGQIQSLYLGDYEGGLDQLEQCRQMWEGTTGEPFPLLRIAQIRILQGRYADAQKLLERARQSDEGKLVDFGRAGIRLVSALLCNALGDETHLRLALDLTTQVLQLCADYPRLGQQYELVAWCEAAAANLALATVLADETEWRSYLEQALDASRAALAIYDACGYVRPIECLSEEVLYRHSLALSAMGQEAEAASYVQRAYDEMMYKHSLIPPDSDFRRSFLENIALHREICAAKSALP